MPTPTKPATAAGPRRGNMTPAEIRPLIMAAREAYGYQEGLGNVGVLAFDAWRHAQVLEAVGLPGLTACSHRHFQPLLAHFKALAGHDDRAFAAYMAPTEDCKHLAHQIVAAIEAHQAAGGGIGLGYLIVLARRITRRPALTLGPDLRTGLAERCDARQLESLRNTVLNRIAAKEGRGGSAAPNKSSRR